MAPPKMMRVIDEKVTKAVVDDIPSRQITRQLNLRFLCMT